MSRLSEDRVRSIYTACLWQDDSVGDKKHVLGIITEISFSVDKVTEFSQEIGQLVSNLKVDVADDMTGTELVSLISSRYDRDDLRWAAEDAPVEKLLMLGMAAGKLERLAVPKVVESRYFPGGRPLYRLTVWAYNHS